MRKLLTLESAVSMKNRMALLVEGKQKQKRLRGLIESLEAYHRYHRGIRDRNSRYGKKLVIDNKRRRLDARIKYLLDKITFYRLKAVEYQAVIQKRIDRFEGEVKRVKAYIKNLPTVKP